MNAGAALANALWLARARGAARRYAAALDDPAAAQDAWLRAVLARDAASAFGRAHDMAAVRGHADFARRVPLGTWDDHAPWIARVRRGEPDVLARGRVSHLAPTSGSTGASKLVPFTAGLQAGFDAAVGAWMHDLARARPALVAGPAYWAISPLGESGVAARADDTVPIGFGDDADYLGGAGAWLVRRALAVPSSVRHVRDLDAFRALTLLALLRARDLRLLSTWHPSFLDLLVEAAPALWPALLDAIACGGDPPWAAALPAPARRAWRAGAAPRRAAELRAIGPHAWERWWPRLQVVSCWGEQAAAPGWRRLRGRLPGVLVQPKGLLATEAVVTIPWRGATPLAVTSHFFEFLDEGGEVRRAHELALGRQYEVVVTNGGGLWRYRLGDVVECTGHVARTPALRFLGRAGHGSDLRGEKLTEAFVAGVLGTLWPPDEPPAYAALRARDDGPGGPAGYELLVSAGAGGGSPLLERLDAALAANPHYALARRLGQLAPPRLVTVAEDHAAAELTADGRRLGDVKPRVLVAASPAPA